MQAMHAAAMDMAGIERQPSICLGANVDFIIPFGPAS
jgi:hypothetical protein